ncbi:PIG-L family deacetylase [Isoptericola sp. NEAU-Y5]|uniref:PIG-L family deacetylase n=1 Tax=Isoptericola luteus TaxID=2879484 RepID=A0ABS7ZCW3_9MICO|nr:PIG-L family deacetylase [Isoptericola sp. NEAU-Y5]MCA5892893.1 PIG-L family deacetylase [Isoptericola sp. NEAU-Y5]
MIALGPRADGPLSVLALGAHPDDVEIGCGGTLLELGVRPDVQVTVVVASGSPVREAEARVAADLFAPGADVRFLGLDDGSLPARWAELKDGLCRVRDAVAPDVVLCPRRTDLHQDHALVAEMTTQVWRDALVLEYEIPKWDGDLDRVTHYVPVSEENARRKVELLDKAYPSQHERDWWDHETFLGLMRLRGIESRSRYAEAFVARKVVLDLGGR